MANVIKLRNVKKTYGSIIKTEVIHGIDLEIKKKSFCSIIGQSGSGKSTLLNIMSTLDLPSSGEIYINHNRTDKMNPNELNLLRNQEMGFIFQFHYLLPEFTAIENVMMPYYIYNRKPTDEILGWANKLLEIVGLSEVKNNYANEMSGGQQQRTAIARALLNKPKIIFADEPTGNLDTNSTEKVYSLLRDLNKRFETTFVVVTHNMHVAERADRIIEIKDGRIEMDILT